MFVLCECLAFSAFSRPSAFAGKMTNFFASMHDMSDVLSLAKVDCGGGLQSDFFFEDISFAQPLRSEL